MQGELRIGAVLLAQRFQLTRTDFDDGEFRRDEERVEQQEKDNPENIKRDLRTGGEDVPPGVREEKNGGIENHGVRVFRKRLDRAAQGW